MEIPEGYFECPVCHQLIKMTDELERNADQKYIDAFGMEKFEEDKDKLVRVCIPCLKILNSYLN